MTLTIMNNVSQNRSGCCECQACEQICSKKAIKMVANEEGFAYPHVDGSLCVNCGLCNKVCPMQHSEELKNEYKTVYAAKINETTVLTHSSSGGMFYLISQFVFDKGGIVFGAAWDNNMKCRHTSARNNTELKRLMGSKYVHSEIGNCYKEIKRLLMENIWVYFTGTPCQVAGLKAYLGKNYPTLLTTDLVCHGTPSQKVFDVFLHAQERDLNQRVVDYNFRDKRIKGWSCTSSSSSINKKGVKQLNIFNRNMQAYFKAFIKGHLSRMDCYNCPFASPMRPGDITIADYWGIRKVHPEFPNPSEGTSMVIVSTDLGLQVWNTVKSNALYINSSMDLALSTGNANLYKSTILPNERLTSYSRIEKEFDVYRRELNRDSDSKLITYLKYYKRQILSHLKK